MAVDYNQLDLGDERMIVEHLSESVLAEYKEESECRDRLPVATGETQ
jgi:hypothetical protein